MFQERPRVPSRMADQDDSGADAHAPGKEPAAPEPAKPAPPLGEPVTPPSPRSGAAEALPSLDTPPPSDPEGLTIAAVAVVRDPPIESALEAALDAALRGAPALTRRPEGDPEAGQTTGAPPPAAPGPAVADPTRAGPAGDARTVAERVPDLEDSEAGGAAPSPPGDAPPSEGAALGDGPTASPWSGGSAAFGAAPRYDILGSIHKGGMGEILLARLEGAAGFSRRVVLKGLLAKLSEDNVSYQLFMREARLMARLDHPNIIRAFDLPFLDGRPYLAMEYLRGRNFHQIIQRSGSTSRGMPIRIALHVVAEALRGLHSAHNVKDESGRLLGVVHRDVSPGNILVSFYGEVKVTDFGIAKLADSPKYTGPRSIRGKARYVAPEQIHGEPASVRSDLYSAGVVLAEALLGAPLWERPSVPETLLAIATEDREKTIDRVLNNRPHIGGLRAALRGALALVPEERFPSALQFAETLEAISRSLGGACTHVDVGGYVRRLFAEAQDVPTQDGFETSGLQVPDFAGQKSETEPTIITLEPEWIKKQRKTESMRAQSPHAPPGQHAPEEAARPPSRAPRAEAPPRPPEPPRRARSHAPAEPVSVRPKIPRPSTGAPPPRRPSSLAHGGARIRASTLPPGAAVVPEADTGGAAEYSFSELIPATHTDEEPSRDLEGFDPKLRLPPAEERARAPIPRKRTSESRLPAPHAVTLLIAGIFIGASLAVAGCVLALILAR